MKRSLKFIHFGLDLQTDLHLGAVKFHNHNSEGGYDPCRKSKFLSTTELVTVWDKEIKPCDGCLACEKTGKCHIQDGVQEIYPKLIEADGIVWGTPVYLWSATAQAKMLIDRSFALYQRKPNLTNKVSGVISVGASLGNLGVWHLFNTFFSVHHMLSTDFVYGYARNKGEVRKDKHAMKAARELGRQIVRIEEQKFKYPEEYDVAIYRYVKREHGIDNCVGRYRFTT